MQPPPEPVVQEFPPEIQQAIDNVREKYESQAGTPTPQHNQPEFVEPQQLSNQSLGNQSTPVSQPTDLPADYRPEALAAAQFAALHPSQLGNPAFPQQVSQAVLPGQGTVRDIVAGLSNAPQQPSMYPQGIPRAFYFN